VEFIHERYPHHPLAEKPLYQLTASCSVPRFVVSCYKLIGALLFGAAVNQAITDICKYSIGRLRPHFLDVCRPNISAGMCDGHVPGTYVYVDNFTCTLPEDAKQLDSRYVWQSNMLSVTGWVVALTCYISHSAKCRKTADFGPSWSRNPRTDFSET